MVGQHLVERREVAKELADVAFTEGRLGGLEGVTNPGHDSSDALLGGGGGSQVPESPVGGVGVAGEEVLVLEAGGDLADAGGGDHEPLGEHALGAGADEDEVGEDPALGGGEPDGRPCRCLLLVE